MYATIDDLTARFGRPLTPAEQAQAEVMLDDASFLLSLKAPGLDAAVDSGDVVITNAAMLAVVAMTSSVPCWHRRRSRPTSPTSSRCRRRSAPTAAASSTAPRTATCSCTRVNSRRCWRYCEATMQQRCPCVHQDCDHERMGT